MKILRYAPLLLVSFFQLIINPAYAGTEAQGEIQAFIEKVYINGAFNKMDTKSMQKGFHSSFKMMSEKEGKLSTFALNDWINLLENLKESKDFDPEKYKREHKFLSIEVTESTAAAEIEIFQNNKLIYTDYILLLKLADGWQIVGKTFHKHN